MAEYSIPLKEKHVPLVCKEENDILSIGGYDSLFHVPRKSTDYVPTNHIISSEEEIQTEST